MGRQRILVTGGGGFVGSCLARDLIASGHEVHLMLRRESSRWRLEEVEGLYVPHEADLRDLAAVRRAVDACRPEVIYHLAAHGALHHQHDRTAILAGNVLGAGHLLEALDHHDYQRLVHVGSSSEYGHQSRPMREDDRLEPRTDYGVSKAAATLLMRAAGFQGRPVAVVRIFSAYGPWEDASRLVPYVMRCCLRGERPRVSAGRQPRDFIHVDDCVELLKLAAELPEAQGQILHAGAGRRQTVRDIVETMLEVCTAGYLHAEFGAEAQRPDEPAVWMADIERTTALTGWRPCYTLAEGIERTWSWYQATHAALAA